jgi:hypothetical protein
MAENPMSVTYASIAERSSAKGLGDQAAGILQILY